MIKAEISGTAMKVSIFDVIDRETENELERLVTWELEGVSELCFDMSGADYITPTIVRIMRYANKQMNNGKITIINANEKIAKLCAAHDLYCS